ncbi:MAG: arylamine N-acetyltransferase [Alphaproteobacteria bacterium]|nr:arylamine N-acetyltransferase [Alphaproteobacteria bacterium]MBU1514772.1 arylamine N-acetyltransferase [Alphaproteobacteria bacterium]MBU2093903.1 arylamine N-acetyltransferase [Alphaproteobacteria bacterium]MBU2153330.1 arylamine N-acetyltransferase [Alphaproteobacteria bacterium]MBU2309758.1 arylamine N-acetyltransferase [Alphaproteobacteria bacterium]
MDIQAYFDRIGFNGVARPDLATLTALHRAHALSISYENMDVQLGRPLTTDPAAAFDKIVRRRRGGWCYEMNGLFGAVLDEIGFKVTRLAGGVMRAVRGDEAIGNHLVLLVDLDGEPWIADVGFGDGPREPYPLRPGPFTCDGYDFSLERLDADGWRLHNQPSGGAPNFDFTTTPADPVLLAAKCQELQTSPESIFVLTAIAQRHMPDEIRMLRGRAFRRITLTSGADSLIDTADDFVTLLKREFELDLPDAAEIWPRIVARHDELFAPQPA